MPPAPPEFGPTPLARYLATLDAEELSEVLRVGLPGGRPARTLGELAGFLENPARVLSRLRALRRDHHEVIDAVLALGVAARPLPLATLLGAYGGEGGVHLQEVLTDLRRAALVWPEEDGRYGVAEPLWEVFPEPLGTAPGIGGVLYGYITSQDLARVASKLGLRAGARKDTRIDALSRFFGDFDRIRAEVAAAPAETRELLEKLAAGDPYVEYEHDTYTTVDGKWTRIVGPQAWARDRLLLVGSYHGVQRLVAEVALALRGPEYRAPFTAEPPPAHTVPVAEAAVDASGQAALAQAVERCDTVLRLLAARPLTELKRGGVGVKEQRRLAAEVGAAHQHTARLWAEIARVAGLAAFRQGAFRVAEGYQDAWTQAEPHDRAALLLRSWLMLGAMPLARTPEAAGEYLFLPAPATVENVVARRRAVLEAFAAVPAGQAAAEPGPLLARAAWLHSQPGVSADLDRDRAEAVVTEAETLGVIAAGALSPVGRALLHPDPVVLSGALREAMPAARTTAYFLADLTATVTGAASASLTALLDSAADRDGTSMSTWRFSPSSVRRALDGGASAADLLAALAGASEKPLPQALEYLLRDVGRRHGEASVVAGPCCVVVREPELLGELLVARELVSLGLRRLAPTVAVSAASPGKTLGALRAAGYFPSGPAGDGEAVTVAPAGPGPTPRSTTPRSTTPRATPPPAGTPPRQARPSRAHRPMGTVEEQAAALVGTSADPPSRRHVNSARWHEVSLSVPHLATGDGYRLASAVVSGTAVRLVVRDDPGHPRGHAVEGLTSAGAHFTGWCASHAVPFSVTSDDIVSVGE